MQLVSWLISLCIAFRIQFYRPTFFFSICIYGSKRGLCIYAFFVFPTNAFKHKVLIDSLVIYQLHSTTGILCHATS